MQRGPKPSCPIDPIIHSNFTRCALQSALLANYPCGTSLFGQPGDISLIFLVFPACGALKGAPKLPSPNNTTNSCDSLSMRSAERSAQRKTIF